MAKFCKYCGAPLEEGQVCSCPQAQAAAQAQAAPVQEQPAPQPQTAPIQDQAAAPQSSAAQEQPQAAPADTGSLLGAAFRNLVPFCKAYLRSPVEATQRAIAQKDLFLPLILLAIQAIVAGLALFAVLAKVCGTIKGIIYDAMGLGGLLGGYSSGLFGSVSVPAISPSFILCLIFGILAAAVAIAVFIGVLYGVTRLMKSACSFRDVVIACGANSPFVTVLLFLAFLLFFASIGVGLFLFIAALLAWVIQGVLTTQVVTPGAQQGKFWMLYIAAVLVTLLVGGWVGSKFFGLSVNAIRISYEDESVTVGQMVDAIGGFDLEDALDDIFYDFF